jgi:chromosomal replication initiation ATPase DnaA
MTFARPKVLNSGCLDCEMTRTPRGGLTVNDIQSACARFFNVPLVDVVGYYRGTHSVMMARKVAMYLARKLTFASWPELGAAFRRDHSTILKVSQRLERTPDDLAIALKVEESIT